ncbi:MAG: hypothetical protein DKM50_00370 [Candidatus Margulisiibacteriota bacterium]|nr:MAG: hypothetical protein DKM50_00370 [Candidatus Margulisiibacteriota bacterium]HCY38190.1 hypothetical protein [Candidatus Margulisiibacteriota bacterium]
MKFGAIYCIYDDHEYLEISVGPLADKLEKILFTVSDIPWNGKVEDNSETLTLIKDMAKRYPNIEIVTGHWETDHDQRNSGIEILYSQGIDYAFIIDSDEVYHEQQFADIISFIKLYPDISVFHIEWNTYWKKDYHRIFPRENFKPVIAVKTNSFLFTHIRDGITAIKRDGTMVQRTDSATYNGMLIPPALAICYHLSYARADEKIKRKIETSPHAGGVSVTWYENIWLKWTLEMRDIHPVIPSQYKRAIPEKRETLPVQLQEFIAKEQLSTK